jgi:pilus assembly protein CpaB
MHWHWLRHPQLWYLVAAALIATLSYQLAQHYLGLQAEAVRAQASVGFRTRDAVVVASDMGAGDRLPEAALAARSVPERFLASDAVLPEEAASVLGQRLLRPLKAGEVLTRSSLEAPAAASIASLVEPGERALTISVDESASAAGLLAPGDAIDLLLVLREEGDAAAGAAGNSPRVLPLLEAVPVIATGRAMRRRSAGETAAEPEASFGTITLRMRPEQAERVLLAQKLGELSVAVRPPGEPATASQPSLAPMGREAVLGRAPRAVARARLAVVEFIVGGTGSGAAGTRRVAGGRT